jgi:hypothetical protein
MSLKKLYIPLFKSREASKNEKIFDEWKIGKIKIELDKKG